NFQTKGGCSLDKVVYGWHPYWVGNAYQNYQWNLISHMSFFSYEVNSADGQPISTHGWSTSAAVDAALASGNTKVTLCVTLFSGHATFFGSPTAQQTLITNLINLVQSRGAHGVNIDFEGLPSSQSTNFANFMVSLANQMHAAIPGSEVSTVLYAVDWNGVFNFSLMEPAVDHYIIMGYDYYYGGSATAGPTDPLYQFGSTYNYTLSRSITYYLDQGCPSSKLIMGLPYYGFDYPTTNLTIPSSTTGAGSSRTYTTVRTNASGNYTSGNQSWISDAVSDGFAYNNGANRQCFLSLDSAFNKRLEHILHTGIGGIGIWALGYDDGYADRWNSLRDYLTDCYRDPCSGTIHDFGGPEKNYYNDENYTWTIAPENATSIDLDFSVFNVELNYDYLYIYDGANTSAPQIPGSPFTGTNSPGQFTSSTGAITFRFTSDGATVAPGFIATYGCSTLPAPTASFTTNTTTICLGDSIQLISTSTDAETYQWSVDEGSIVNADSSTAMLIPVASGNYSITLTVGNATAMDVETSQVLVQVVSPPSLDATVSSQNVALPDATVFFTNNSTNASSYLWDFGDGSTSTDFSPWHSYAQSGSYTVTLTAFNPPCQSEEMSWLIEVGISSLSEQKGGVQVYPNPFDQTITIVNNDGSEKEYSLQDLNGKEIQRGFIVNDSNVLDLNCLSSGVYLLKIGSESENTVMKIVKQ
ncbi:MAG: PKD domain-containing protein, partial [Bacteroidetes bacterium]